MPLGIVAQTGNMDTYAARNGRRKVFYAVPGGAATLTGLMALTEPEETDGPSFDWSEQRFSEKTAVTVAFASNGPWQDRTGATGTTIAFSMSTPGTTNQARLKITPSDDIKNWSIGERITIHRQKNSAAAIVPFTNARVVGVDEANSVLTILLDAAITVDNDSAQVGMLITSEGVAQQEGSLSGTQQAQIWPNTPANYTQIWRKGVNFTATALRQPMFFDIGGKYRSDLRDAAVAHMVEIENSLIFGQKTTRTVIDPTGGTSVVRTSGGIIWHLQQYESANGGTALYRPGGSALTLNTDDDKRIIVGDSSGAVTNAVWEALEERMFRRTMQSANEKLLIGGSGMLAAVTKYYSTKGNGIQINRSMEDEFKLSFRFHTVETRYGTLHLKSHPRFNDRSTLRNCALVVDLPNLRFRPMVGRDSHLRENIHIPSYDGRQDEYLTEGGFEVRYPESHMFFQNVSSIATS